MRNAFVAISPTSDSIIASTLTYEGQGRTKLWSLKNTSDQAMVGGGVVRKLAFMDAASVLTVGYDASPSVWKLDSGEVVRYPHAQQYEGGRLTSMAGIPGKQSVAVGNLDGLLHLFDLADGKLLRKIRACQGALAALAVSPDGKTLATGGADGVVRIWDLKTGAEELSCEEQKSAISGLAFIENGQVLLFTSGGNAVFCDARTGRRQSIVSLGTHRISTLTVSATVQLAAAGDAQGGITILDLTKGIVQLRFQGHGDSVRALAFSPDGRTLASGSADETVKLWDPHGGNERLTLKGHTSRVLDLAFSPDGSCLVSGGRDAVLRVWRSASQQRLDSPGQEAP
jgi:WD40 repeat protein